MIFDLQKASLLKRTAAFLLDVILLAVITVGLAFAVSAIVGYDSRINELNDYYEKFDSVYGIDLLSAETDDSELDAAVTALIASNPDAKKDYDGLGYTFSLVMNLTLVIISISLLLGYAITEFIIPMIFKNGQTVGKKVFSLAVMRTNGVKLGNISLFIRAFLGKYTIEAMVPVLIILMVFFNSIGIVGIIVLGAILLTEIVFFIATHTNSFIHDIISDTVVVDMSSQLIFESEEARLEYIKKTALAASEKDN